MNYSFAWIRWYFKPGAAILLTGPLFLVILYCFGAMLFAAFIQGLALFRVAPAVFGPLILLLTPVAISLIIMPAVFYYSLAKDLPAFWKSTERSKSGKVLLSLLALLVFPLLSWAAYQGIGLGIGWIADFDPCASGAVGVTGTAAHQNCR